MHSVLKQILHSKPLKIVIVSESEQVFIIPIKNIIPPYFTQSILFWFQIVKTVSNFHRRQKPLEKSGGFVMFAFLHIFNQKKKKKA